MESGYEPSLDVDAELVTDRIVARMRDALARVPLRSAYVDALGVEARPAIQALLFALSTDQAENTNSLEHHETTAMVALLGRAFAFDGTTPTAAAAVIPSLLTGFRGESIDVPSSLDHPLAVVFLEGYVRGREERVRVEAGKRALESVSLVRLAPRVGLVVIHGAHEPEQLTARLEAIAREAFALEIAACVFDVAIRESGDAVLGPVTNAIELLRQVGTDVVVAGASSGMFPESVAQSRDSTPDAVALAMSVAGLAIGRDRALPRTLRALLRARGGARG